MNGLVLLLILWICFSEVNAAPDKIRMNDVTALTFYKDQYTTGRRVSPIMQLKRVGGSAKYGYEPEFVQCSRVGHDGYDAQWRCEATDLQANVKLGKVEVVCEGFDYPEDPYILRGSCGLEYYLESNGGNNYKNNNYRGYEYQHESDSLFGSILGIIIFGGITFFILKTCCGSRDAWGNRGNGGGYGPNNGPYGPNNGPYGPNNGPYPSSGSNSTGGFFNGFLTGSIISSLFRPRNRYYSPYTPRYGGFSSGGGFSSSPRTSSVSFGGTRRR